MLEVRHRRAFALSLYLALSGVSGLEAPASQYLCEVCVEGQGRPASEEAARWVKFLQDARRQMGLDLVGERGSTGVDGESHRRKLYHVGSAEGTFMMDALMWKVDKEMQNAQNTLRQSLMGEDLSMPTLPADDDGRSNSESFAKKLYEKYKSSSHSKPRSKDVKVDATAGEVASGVAEAADASGPSGGSVQMTDKSVASARGGSAGAAGATSSNGVKEGAAQSSGRSSTAESDGGNQPLKTAPASPSEPPQTSKQQQQTGSVAIPSSTPSTSTAELSSATTSQQSSARASQTGSSLSAPAERKFTTSPSYTTEGSGNGEARPSSGVRVQDGRGGQYAATQDKNDLLLTRQGQQEALLHGTGLRGAGR